MAVLLHRMLNTRSVRKIRFPHTFDTKLTIDDLELMIPKKLQHTIGWFS